jgi:hypothetical protein
VALSEQVQALLDGLGTEEARLQAAKDQLMAQVAELDVDLRRLTAIRRAAVGQHPGGKKGASGVARADADLKPATEQQIAKVWEAWRGRTEPMTPSQLYDHSTGFSNETAQRATIALRDRGFLIVAGQQRGRPQYLPAPDMPANALESLNGAAA